MVNTCATKPTEPMPRQQQLFNPVQRLGQPEVQQRLQPLVQPQTTGLYVYWVPSLGRVIVPDDVAFMLQGLTSLNLEEQYERIEREVMGSTEMGSEQQERSGAGFQNDDVERTLFVTFSRGFPIKPTILRDYFTSEYGDVVEAVFPQIVKAKESPLYARVLLKSVYFVNLVLQGQEKLKLKLAGRDAWMRPYIRKIPNGKDSLHLDKGRPRHP